MRIPKLFVMEAKVFFLKQLSQISKLFNGQKNSQQKKAPGINSGAKNDYLTVDTSGMVMINFSHNKKLFVIPTAIKVDELLALEGDQMIDRGDIRAVVSETIVVGIGLYFPHGDSNSWLIIVSREDLSKLVS